MTDILRERHKMFEDPHFDRVLLFTGLRKSCLLPQDKKYLQDFKNIFPTSVQVDVDYGKPSAIFQLISHDLKRGKRILLICDDLQEKSFTPEIQEIFLRNENHFRITCILILQLLPSFGRSVSEVIQTNITFNTNYFVLFKSLDQQKIANLSQRLFANQQNIVLKGMLNCHLRISKFTKYFICSLE